MLTLRLPAVSSRVRTTSHNVVCVYSLCVCQCAPLSSINVALTAVLPLNEGLRLGQDRNFCVPQTLSPQLSFQRNSKCSLLYVTLSRKRDFIPEHYLNRFCHSSVSYMYGLFLQGVIGKFAWILRSSHHLSLIHI